MASLSRERNSIYRIHWKFKIKLGPREGETVEGSLQLGRCTKTAAKAKLREIDEWQEATLFDRLVVAALTAKPLNYRQLVTGAS